MTVPGGVPNLPVGALTLENLQSSTQDMSGTAMKSRAVARFPTIFNGSTGLSPASDITPFGILTRIFSEVFSLVANADPADVQGPEDLPPMVLEFIEGLPLIGQFVGILEAILGDYDGDDETLLAIQALFAPIRAVVDAVTSARGILDPEDFFDLINSGAADLSSLLSGSGLGSFGSIGTAVASAASNFTSLFSGMSVGNVGSLITNLLGTASTASTANTNANTANGSLSSLLSGSGLGSFSAIGSAISSAASNFASLFSGLGVANITGAVSSWLGTASTASTASTNASTNATKIGSLITNLFGGSSILTQVQPGAVGGVTSGASLLTDVQSFLSNVFGGITRTSGTTATQGDTLDAVSAQANTVTSTAATMEQILAALGQGTPDSDDFERTSSSSLGANWNVQQTGTGTLSTANGHDASTTGTGSSYEFTARKTDKVASTNHQVATIVLATAFPSYKLFTPLPYGGYIDCWVRMSAFTTFATRTGLRFRINGNPPYQATWTIDWVSSGTVTNLASGTLASIPGAGASIAFEVGVGGNTLAYQARVNGSPVANFTDSTNKGLGNTGRGFGGKGNSGVGTAQGVPNIQQWTAQG